MVIISIGVGFLDTKSNIYSLFSSVFGFHQPKNIWLFRSWGKGTVTDTQNLLWPTLASGPIPFCAREGANKISVSGGKANLHPGGELWLTRLQSQPTAKACVCLTPQTDYNPAHWFPCFASFTANISPWQAMVIRLLLCMCDRNLNASLCLLIGLSKYSAKRC